ncbi:MAG TPA: TRAP transporter substrate-binding protein DctP, partial [Ramlibacter sp.]|nr:TRAP transporter substrate-binding protein DctP [Ramlibacter sp.]
TNSARPITRMEDLNGVKLRVMQNTVFLESFKTLGAQAVPLSFNELFGALNSNVVDGQENPFNTILSSKFYEVQKYLSVTNHVYSPWIVMVSKKHWDQLSPGEQEVLKKAAKASQEFERRDTRQEAAKALAELAAKGMKVNELSFAEASRMRNRLTRVYATIGANVGMELMIETQNQLMQIRSGKAAPAPM